MNMRRLGTLLILWCVFLLAPGVLVMSGAFGHFDSGTEITGGIGGLWVVGYLVQFGTFLWIMNIVGEQKVLWWFVASLLPWGIDWILPVSRLFILLWLPLTVAVAGWIWHTAQRAESLRVHGIRATGVVLEVLKPRMNVVINNVYIKRKVRLRIEREDGTPSYEGILNGLFMLGEIPSPGDRIPLLVDPANPQRFEYNKGASTTRTASAHPAASHETRRTGVADELERLARLHERGALTDSEFNAAKKKLLQ